MLGHAVPAGLDEAHAAGRRPPGEHAEQATSQRNEHVEPANQITLDLDGPELVEHPVRQVARAAHVDPALALANRALSLDPLTRRVAARLRPLEPGDEADGAGLEELVGDHVLSCGGLRRRKIST